MKNYAFDYEFAPPWGRCSVTFTAVSGHIMAQAFPSQFKNWDGCDPGALFDAPINRFVEEKNVPIAENIKRQARGAFGLFIWTDCDREGENIGAQIREIACSANSQLDVKRAHFSNIESARVMSLARHARLR